MRVKQRAAQFDVQPSKGCPDAYKRGAASRSLKTADMRSTPLYGCGSQCS